MKNCLIIANSLKTDAYPLSKQITEFLEKKGIFVSSFFYNGTEAQKENPEVDFNGVDFVITLGGDGTVLFVCRKCAPLNIPVFSVNLGEFGFVAGVDKAKWKKSLENFLAGNLCGSERNLLECEVLRGGKTVFTGNAMNDMIVSSYGTSRLVNLEVAYNRAVLGPFKANGIIVSTPTGSTAYSAAAGGPIIDPAMEAMVLTPISSFSLSARPLVFGKGEIAITVIPSRASLCLTLDGQIEFVLEENDVVIMNVSDYKAKLACSTQEKFYSALQSKLNWSGGPRA